MLQVKQLLLLFPRMSQARTGREDGGGVDRRATTALELQWKFFGPGFHFLVLFSVGERWWLFGAIPHSFPLGQIIQYSQVTVAPS